MQDLIYHVILNWHFIETFSRKIKSKLATRETHFLPVGIPIKLQYVDTPIQNPEVFTGFNYNS